MTAIKMTTIQVTGIGKRSISPEYLTKEYYNERLKPSDEVVSVINENAIDEIAENLLDNILGPRR